MACFFLYSGASLSSSFGGGIGPPGFLANELTAVGLGFVEGTGICPLGDWAIFPFGLGVKLKRVSKESGGDR